MTVTIDNEELILSYKVYGIKNCDTVKKAIKELDELGIDYEFVDFKKTPPRKEWVLRWEKFWGELPANKEGPTFRKIKDEYEAAASQKSFFVNRKIFGSETTYFRG